MMGLKEGLSMKTMTLIACVLALCGGCEMQPETVDAGKARLWDGLGSHQRKVTTASPEAQKFFDQALVYTFAFNHDEAIKSYTEAARLDPDMPMAWWGIALCNGPHINNAAMDEAHSKAAWEALQKAL